MTTDTAITPDNYDTPWKEAIEHHFPEFMAFYFPDAHRQIDWQQGHTFLDQELQSVVQALMATSNSPTFGQSNSPRQDD